MSNKFFWGSYSTGHDCKKTPLCTAYVHRSRFFASSTRTLQALCYIVDRLARVQGSQQQHRTCTRFLGKIARALVMNVRHDCELMAK